MLVPQASSYASGLRNPPFPVPQTIASYSTASNPPSSSDSLPSGSSTSFRAPAHKHAHHLHSIPPREKSTRTLIIDHMLWVHGRTRFTQARAELGMTDRTGGPSSPNYVHRRRPENYEEEDDENSEGEDVVKLKARAGGSNHPPGDDEEDRLHAQDLTLARSLRLRAEGLEKVVTSMLGQPPTCHPINDEDIWTPPTSPKMDSSYDSKHHHLHTLPNGVRLRLALGTIINDLFARQAPSPPYRHQFHPKSPSEQSPASSSSLLTQDLPLALSSLSTICATHSGSTTPRLMSHPSSSNYPSYPPQNHGHHQQQQHQHQHQQQQHPQQQQQQQPNPSSRTRSFYKDGADPTTANSPPSFRCPRHLHTGCEICVQAKTGTRPGAGSSSGRSTSFGGGQNSWKAMPGGVGPGGGGITGWQDGSGIGSGLLKPGVHGSCLRRKDSTESEEAGASTGAGNTKLSELIPRFIRLSALVAAELAAEAREEEDTNSMRPKDGARDRYAVNDGDWAHTHSRQDSGFSPLLSPMSPSTARSVSQAQDKAHDAAFRPTREWYMLLAGLLTRAVLQGYLTAGWRGTQPVECLLTVGLGMAESIDVEESGGDFEEFDPDDLPTLLEATKLLFPAFRTSAPPRKSQAEEEYETEMRGRLQRFYDIPASTPDLSTHMEDLAWLFPAEPVERAAVRFCEAIAKWRGKPELETYKKRSPTSTYTDSQTTPGGSSLTMSSLVHSNPPTPTMANSMPTGSHRRIWRKPSIDMYFIQPSLFRGSLWNHNKRTRSPDDTRSGSAKRMSL